MYLSLLKCSILILRKTENVLMPTIQISFAIPFSRQYSWFLNAVLVKII